EDAQVPELVGHPASPGVVVVVCDPEQHAQAGPDSADRGPSDRAFGARHPWHHRSHVTALADPWSHPAIGSRGRAPLVTVWCRAAGETAMTYSLGVDLGTTTSAA